MWVEAKEKLFFSCGLGGFTWLGFCYRKTKSFSFFCMCEGKIESVFRIAENVKQIVICSCIGQ